MKLDSFDNRRRKALLAALRDSQARVHALLNATSDACVLLSPDGSILAANENAAEVLDTPAAQLTGACVFDLLPPANVEPGRTRIAEVFRTGLSDHWEVKIGDKTIYVHAHPVQQPGRGPSAVAICAEDLTEQERLDEQFHQAQKMGMLGRLAVGIAHDVRNMLTVIKGYAGMLRKQSLVKPQGRDMVAEIEEATDKSAELAGLLLVLSRQEPYHTTRVDMAKSIAKIAKALPGMLGRGVRLSVAAEVSDCWVNVDTNRLQQAIFNLAINARDAMPRGGELSIRTSHLEAGADFVSVHPGSRPGRYCVVTVRDTGHGMDKATLGKIFESGFTTKGPGEGSGLGLAMVRAFVRESDGFIDVESDLATGTTFRLYFPCDWTSRSCRSSRRR